MDAVTLTYARARLGELAGKAEAGEETIITRRGKPVARLVPIGRPKISLRSLAAFRATLTKSQEPTANLIRHLRDEGR